MPEPDFPDNPMDDPSLYEGRVPDDPFQFQVKERLMRRIYNPKTRKWEYEDGSPVPEAPKREPGKRLMGYGKYHDHYIEEVPTWYLEYVLREHEDRDGLHADIEAELASR